MGELDKLRDLLRSMSQGLVDKTKTAILEEAELIKAESMENTPIEHGVLKASHEIVGPETDGKEWKITIQVGGAAEPYAMAVHEHLSAYSPPSWLAKEAAGRPVHFNVGGPKFLENAVRKAIPGFGSRIADRVRAS